MSWFLIVLTFALPSLIITLVYWSIWLGRKRFKRLAVSYEDMLGIGTLIGIFFSLVEMFILAIRYRQEIFSLKPGIAFGCATVSGIVSFFLWLWFIKKCGPHSPLGQKTES